MGFSEHLLEAAAPILDAQRDHPFVVELAEGRLDEAAFRYWIEQDYQYLLDYARVFAIAATKADDEPTMSHLLGIAHRVVDEELDLHRELAAECGIEPSTLGSVRRAPTCVAYTDFLLRVAHQGSIAEISAAVFPCGQGYLDVAEHMARLADGEHRYTPFIETYTGERFREAVEWLRAFVDRCAEAQPGARDAMREAFLTSVRLEYEFWEMAYTREAWSVERPRKSESGRP